MSQPLILIAAGGLAREVIATVNAAGKYEVIGILDDDVLLHRATVGGVKVLGGTDWVAKHPDVRLLVTAGSSEARQKIVERLSGLGVRPDRFVTIIHPSVEVPATCHVGPGTVLLAQVVLTADVVVGAHVIVMPHVVLTHDDVVEDYATLCAGVVLGGGVHVERGAYLGMNASVRQRLRVGKGSVLGAGAVLIRDLPQGQTWAGVPARWIGSTPRFSRGEATVPARVLGVSMAKGDVNT